MVYTSDYPIISVTVDVVCLARRDGERQVLLVERGSDPFQGRLAFPGGFVDIDEDLEDAALRELREETSLATPGVLEQLGAYGRPGRDPRGRTVSIVYLALPDEAAAVRGGDDAADAGWYPITELLQDPGRLAFDHAEILRDALARARFETAPQD
jgi:8-oxo-dGTP diphosphatase